jgi:hypothetical protein
LAIARLREAADAPNAARILQHNYYGWFERVARGVYALTPLGVRALDHFTTPAPAAKVKTAA